MLEATDALSAARHETIEARSLADGSPSETPEQLKKLEDALSALTVAIDDEIQHSSGPRADDMRAERSRVAAEKAVVKVRLQRVRETQGR